MAGMLQAAAQSLIAPIVIGDPVSISGGSADGLPSLRKITVGGVTDFIKAIFDLQSTTAFLHLNKMTTDQRDAITFVDNGAIVFITDIGTGVTQARENNAWVTLSNNAGGIYLASDGSAAAPSFSFSSDTDTGIYHPAPNVLGFAAGGTLQLEVLSPGASVNYLTVTGGTAGLPVTIGVAGEATIGLILKSIGNGDVGGAGGIRIKGDGVNVPVLRLYNIAGDHFTGLQAGNPGADVVYELPESAATVDQSPLVVDIDGSMYFSDESIKFKRVDVTNKQLKEMSTVAVVPIIAAPLATQTIVIHNVRFSYLFNVAAFTGGGTTYLQYDTALHSGVHAASEVDVTFLQSASSQIATEVSLLNAPAAPGDIFGDFQAYTALRGKAITLTNDTAAFATGSGTMSVYVWYSIINN